MKTAQRMMVGVAAVGTFVAAMYAVAGTTTGHASQAAISAIASQVVAAAPEDGGSYSVDIVHSSVLYRVKHVGASWHWGRFNDFSGSFAINSEKPEASLFDLTIKTESVDSGNADRDKHLRSQDFFSAKEFPSITFKSTKVAKTGDKTFDVTGDLTLMGVTKPVTASVEFVGTGEMRGVKKAGIEAKFEIKRSDFGMSKMVGPIGDEVSLIVSLEGDRK
jgi:polyisoprenoid-binding protein YceI